MKENSIIVAAVRRVKQNDKVAMNLLYNTYVKDMLNLSYRITNNLADSEDIIQESFLHSFQKINQLKQIENYAGWLKRMVVNNSLKKIKKRNYFKPIEEEDYEDKEETTNWYVNIPFDVISAAIQALPNGCREILTLYLLDGYKHIEIAALLDISISTSKSQYRYGLGLLRQRLKNSIHEQV